LKVGLRQAQLKKIFQVVLVSGRVNVITEYIITVNQQELQRLVYHSSVLMIFSFFCDPAVDHPYLGLSDSWVKFLTKLEMGTTWIMIMFYFKCKVLNGMSVK